MSKIIEKLPEMNIQASPDVLWVFRNTNMELWQALAELIDNSLDATVLAGKESGEVHMDIDKGGLRVQDNGAGMTYETMQKSITAGFTNKKRGNELGCFGVGFNIATMVLGQGVTRVYSRHEESEEDYWTVTTIDVPDMMRKSSWMVPAEKIAKPAFAKFDHGTIVELTLKEAHLANLMRKKGLDAVKEELGKVYGYMLRDEVPGLDPKHAGQGVDFNIYMTVGNKVHEVAPYLPCIWDQDRHVLYKNNPVKAVRYIDVELGESLVCHSCRRSEPSNVASPTCDLCGQPLEKTTKRVWGWIGIQRHMDEIEFGFNVYRNGRAILRNEKDPFFTFTHPETGVKLLEYPVEMPNYLGRIVGEIHCDHVSVDSTKMSFRNDDGDWDEVVHAVGGEAPLRPHTASDLGMVNESPLYEMFCAYRNNMAGTDCLMPGTKNTKPKKSNEKTRSKVRAMHKATVGWGLKFRANDPEYWTDDYWWKQAEKADRISAGESDAPSPTSDPSEDSGTETGAGGIVHPPTPPVGGDGDSTSTGGRERTATELRSHFQSMGEVDPYYSMDVRFKSLNNKVYTLKVWETSADIMRQGKKEDLAARAERVSGQQIEGFYNPSHKQSKDFGRSSEEVLLWEIARVVLEQQTSGSKPSLGTLFWELLSSFPDEKQSTAIIKTRIGNLESLLRQRFKNLVAAQPKEFWGKIPDDFQAEIEEAGAGHYTSGMDEWIKKGEWCQHVSLQVFAGLIRLMPEEFFDRKLLEQSWPSRSREKTRERTLHLVLGAFEDLILFSTVSQLTVYEMNKADNSLSHIQQSVVSDSDQRI